MDRADIVHEAFLARVSAGEFPSGDAPYGPLSSFEAVAIFRAQCLSRNLDRRSRKMQSAGQGFYTIGSSGHEGMAAVASALSGWGVSNAPFCNGAWNNACLGYAAQLLHRKIGSFVWGAS